MLINYEPRYGMSLNTSDLTRLTKYVEDDSDSNHHFHVIISISEPICRLCDKYGAHHSHEQTSKGRKPLCTFGHTGFYLSMVKPR